MAPCPNRIPAVINPRDAKAVQRIAPLHQSENDIAFLPPESTINASSGTEFQGAGGVLVAGTAHIQDRSKNAPRPQAGARIRCEAGQVGRSTAISLAAERNRKNPCIRQPCRVRLTRLARSFIKRKSQRPQLRQRSGRLHLALVYAVPAATTVHEMPWRPSRVDG
jgi:hypothetical protein